MGPTKVNDFAFTKYSFNVFISSETRYHSTACIGVIRCIEKQLPADGLTTAKGLIAESLLMAHSSEVHSGVLARIHSAMI
jgi:hypothetical protein